MALQGELVVAAAPGGVPGLVGQHGQGEERPRAFRGQLQRLRVLGQGVLRPSFGDLRLGHARAAPPRCSAAARARR